MIADDYNIIPMEHKTIRLSLSAFDQNDKILSLLIPKYCPPKSDVYGQNNIELDTRGLRCRMKRKDPALQGEKGASSLSFLPSTAPQHAPQICNVHLLFGLKPRMSAHNKTLQKHQEHQINVVWSLGSLSPLPSRKISSNPPTRPLHSWSTKASKFILLVTKLAKPFFFRQRSGSPISE